MRLVDDDDGGFSVVVAVFFDSGLQASHQLPLEVPGREIELVCDGVEDAAHADGWVVDIDGVDLFFFDLFGEGPDGGRFSAPDFAGDKGDTGAAKQLVEALKEGFELLGHE